MRYLGCRKPLKPLSTKSAGSELPVKFKNDLESSWNMLIQFPDLWRYFSASPVLFIPLEISAMQKSLYEYSIVREIDRVIGPTPYGSKSSVGM